MSIPPSTMPGGKYLRSPSETGVAGVLFAWVFEWTQGDRGPDHDPRPAPFISEHHLGACSGVKVNAVTVLS